MKGSLGRQLDHEKIFLCFVQQWSTKRTPQITWVTPVDLCFVNIVNLFFPEAGCATISPCKQREAN